uniref:PH-interacting protein n=1 Tax=Tanacetum cinerariifolium TaxID=118510 RepID=A0A6L2KTA3_TANCI|nr:PH-interacting protein [Tanacetum cinerariifolium]
MEIVPDDGDEVLIEATPISSRSPTIINYKIYKEGNKNYSRSLEQMEILKFKKEKPVDDMDNFLFRTLKTMFEHHVEDTIWTYQQGLAKVKNWKLFGSFGVYYIIMQSTVYYLLVEKKLEDSEDEYQVFGRIVGIKSLQRVTVVQRPSLVRFDVGTDISHVDQDYQVPLIADMDILMDLLSEFLDVMDWEPKIEVHSDDKDFEYNVTEECHTSKTKKIKAEANFMNSSRRRVKRRNLDGKESSFRDDLSRKSRFDGEEYVLEGKSSQSYSSEQETEAGSRETKVSSENKENGHLKGKAIVSEDLSSHQDNPKRRLVFKLPNRDTSKQELVGPSSTTPPHDIDELSKNFSLINGNGEFVERKENFGSPMKYINHFGESKDEENSRKSFSQAGEDDAGTLDHNVPSAERVKISSTNIILETTVPQKEEIFQVIIDVIKNSTCFKAFTRYADVPKLFMHQFWYTIKKVQDTDSYEFLLANKKCIVNAKVFRTIPNICPRVEDEEFIDVLDDETALVFLIDLGYKESDPEPAKKKTFSRRVVKKKVTLSTDDNIIFNDHDASLKLAKSICQTEAEKAEATRKVHATHARIVTEYVLESAKKKSSGRIYKSVVIQVTLSAPKSKHATSKSMLNTGTKAGIGHSKNV